MRQYFENMDPLGKPLSPKQTESMQDNCKRVEEVMKQIDAEVERIKNVGVPLQNLHVRGELSDWSRAFYVRRNASRWTFRSSPVSTPLIPPAAAIRRSVLPFSWRIKRLIW